MDLDWNVQAPLVIQIGAAHIGFHGHVGLAAHVEIVLDHIARPCRNGGAVSSPLIIFWSK